MRSVLWLLSLPFRLIRRFATIFAVLALVASLAFNVATLTVTGVYAAASSALNAVGVTTVAAREAGERLTRRKAAQKIGRETTKRVSRRVQRGAVRNISSVAGEAIPVVGVAVIAGALSLEVKDACDTAADMAGLEAALAAEADHETARQLATDAFDCTAMIREQLPDFEELPSGEELLRIVTTTPQAAWDAAAEYYDGLVAPDWSTRASEARDAFREWANETFTADTAEYLRNWWGDEGATDQ
ncbi:hypothetical protein [Sedimentitalea todarodis]|uniref:Uncharacterized protein n=1 Tax=Sedimentitalea todarodis TaxID=1631240 RepID=A0ABU3V9G0_9RHOB|nr:hypothetical protein [Sedimentitalea todarodis]MDU9002795.1 hypothetical protein [Sedimentitalea todarodis]